MFTPDDLDDALIAADIPTALKTSIDGYVNHGRPLGYFLSYVIENDLASAVVNADNQSLLALPDIVRLFNNHVPFGAFGSRERREAWMKQGGWRGLNDPANDHRNGITADGWGDGAEAAR